MKKDSFGRCWRFYFYSNKAGENTIYIYTAQIIAISRDQNPQKVAKEKSPKISGRSKSVKFYSLAVFYTFNDVNFISTVDEWARVLFFILGLHQKRIILICDLHCGGFMNAEL